MRDYVVQTGPLRTFEGLYDSRWEKIRNVENHPTIQITVRPGTKRLFMAEYSRSTGKELRFVSGFFESVIAGHRIIFGMRDVNQGKARALADTLVKQKKLNWFDTKYSISEDDLTVVELKDFSDDFKLIQPFAPPEAGGLFFYLTRASLDLLEVYWLRCARSAEKSKDDPFCRDVIGNAHDSKIVLMQDQDGSFTVVVHPKVVIDPIQQAITEAGAKAGMEITFAPGLFG